MTILSLRPHSRLQVGIAHGSYGMVAYGDIGHGISYDPGQREVWGLAFNEESEATEPGPATVYGVVPYGGIWAGELALEEIDRFFLNGLGVQAVEFVEDIDLPVMLRVDGGEVTAPFFTEID